MIIRLSAENDTDTNQNISNLYGSGVLDLENIILVVQEDKFRLWYSTIDKVKPSISNFFGPLGIILALFTSIQTSEFKDGFLDKSTWEAIFIIIVIMMSIYD